MGVLETRTPKEVRTPKCEALPYTSLENVAEELSELSVVVTDDQYGRTSMFEHDLRNYLLDWVQAKDRGFLCRFIPL